MKAQSIAILAALFVACAETDKSNVLNAPPQMTSAQIDRDTYREDTVLKVSVAAEDPEGDEIAYEFHWQKDSGDGFVDIAGHTATLSGKSFDKGDLVRVVVTPSDANGTGAAFESKAVAIENTAPMLESVTLAPAAAYETSTLTATALASDIDPADRPRPENYAYTWLVNGVQVKQGSGVGFAALDGSLYAKGDAVAVRVAYTDGAAESPALDSAAVTIQNSTPVMTAITLSGAAPYLETTPSITATPTATDSDAEALTYAYVWYVNGVSVGTGTEIDNSVYSKHDEIQVRVVAADAGFGASSSAPLYSPMITVENSAPTLASAGITSVGTPAYGTGATFYVNTWTDLADSDPADAPVLTYQWYVNGVPVVGQTGAALGAGYAAEGDSVYAQVTPSDGDAFGLPVNAPAATIVNTPPTIGSVDFGAGPFYKNTLLTAAAFGAADADAADSVSVEYRWFVNGVAGVTTATMNSGMSTGATVSVAARSFDGADYSAWAVSPVATVVNRKPAVDALTITPVSPSEATTLTIATLTGHDDDTDTVVYHRMWFVNAAATGITSATLTGAAFDHFDSVYVQVTPHDGTEYGAAVSSNAVTVTNTMPTKPGITKFPGAYGEDDTLYVVVTTASTDPDPDTVTYAYTWYMNGVTQAFAAGTTAVAASSLAAGETWTVVVTPTDGYAAGPTAFAQWTITDWFSTALSNAPAARGMHTAVWTGTEMVIWGGRTGGASLDSGARYLPATDTWLPVSTSGLAARYDHTAVWTGREMIIWGGWDETTYFNDGSRYDPRTDSWSPVSAAGLSARWGHSAVWSGRNMLVWGGFTGSAWVNSGSGYDPVTNAWSPISPSGPAGRTNHAAVWTGREMIVWGGYSGAYENTGSRYDPQSDSWSAMSSSGLAGRERLTAAWTGTELLVWGGIGASSALFGDGGRYDPRTDTWSAMSTSGLAGRYLNAAAWTGRQLLVWGGWTGSYADTGKVYDPRSNTWTAVDAPSLSARREHTAVWTGREVVIWGGMTATGMANDGARYVPPRQTETWAPASASGLDGRGYHTAVWTGSEMIVWGGYNGAVLDSGGRYNPATDTWLATSTPTTARLWHTAAWTGREMIVWGGFDGVFTISGTGERYDPSTDTWSPVNPAGPAGRALTASVWTGREMIFWGGYVDAVSAVDNYGSTGGRYNPATDTWSATSASGLTGRDDHVAVWTGREMIVWGGFRYDGSDYIYENTGARYDPRSDTWAPTSTSGLSGRDFPTAVWTGTEMIVWGGAIDTSGTSEDTGARYNPRTDTWLPVSASGLAGRTLHTAVWTGREMLIWGGYNGASVFDDGARYDPRTDTWAALSATAPAARNWHTAVWTGGEMIVWGGVDLTPTYLHDAGRYRPARP